MPTHFCNKLFLKLDPHSLKRRHENHKYITHICHWEFPQNNHFFGCKGGEDIKIAPPHASFWYKNRNSHCLEIVFEGKNESQYFFKSFLDKFKPGTLFFKKKKSCQWSSEDASNFWNSPILLTSAQLTYCVLMPVPLSLV